MKASVLLVGAILTFGAATAFADGGPFRELQRQIRALQQQIDELREQVKESQLEITFRDTTVTSVLAPGEEAVVALPCLDGEVAISGGYNSEPSEPLQITLNTLFFDGVHSGWRTDFLNASDATVTVDLRVTGSCAKGRGLPEDE